MIASFLFHSVVHTTSLSTQRFSWTWHMPVLQTPLLAPFHKTLLQPITVLPFPELAVKLAHSASPVLCSSFKIQ